MQTKMSSMIEPEVPIAVIVGLCAHGVGIARDLHRQGVHVLALEKNRKLPGVATSCADIQFVDDVDGPGLVSALSQLAEYRRFSRKPILFLTNDRMVETIGNAAGTIAKHYTLSWLTVAENILPLLNKENIEGRCHVVGLNYPRSVILNHMAEMNTALGSLKYPLIAKPIRPLSKFKTLILDSAKPCGPQDELIAQSLPVVIQEFISGDDSQIFFGALLLDHGEVLARFEGRKLRSRPMGHTTVALSMPSDEIHELARRFFSGENYSGPVSLEVKKDCHGKYWVIEPTVGRTDFWIGICSANGVNIPWIEYQFMAEKIAIPANQSASCYWINGERDPGALIWLLWNYPKVCLGYIAKGVYFDLADLRPWLLSTTNIFMAVPGRLFRKICKRFKQFGVR